MTMKSVELLKLANSLDIMKPYRIGSSEPTIYSLPVVDDLTERNVIGLIHLLEDVFFVLAKPVVIGVGVYIRVFHSSNGLMGWMRLGNNSNEPDDHKLFFMLLVEPAKRMARTDSGPEKSFGINFHKVTEDDNGDGSGNS